MNKNSIKIKFICVILALFCLFNIYKTSNFNVKALSNDAEIVLEVNSKRVLYQKNAYDKKFMASTTKILTAITVIENFDINKEITISNKTVGIEGSSIYLEEGEILTVKDLLYGLMLRSGNDCAETLAVELAGSIDDFSKLMNELAQKIGALNSNFVNPHGLHDDNHYTTAYDLALISAYAINNDTFKEIVSTKYVEIPWTTRNYNRKLYNKNKMLSRYEGCTGIKTGFTKKAGRCLVTSCEKDGLELICVVLNCGPMWERTANLLDNCYSTYKNTKILESDNIIDFIKVNGQKIGVYIKNDVLLPFEKKEINDIRVEFEYIDFNNKFIKKDSEIGKVLIYCKNNLLFSEKIYNIVDINY